MAASFSRSLEAVNGARFARRLRRPEAIDILETSEVHASMRSTAWRVTDRGGAAPVGEVWALGADGKMRQFASCTCKAGLSAHPVTVDAPRGPSTPSTTR